MVDDIVVLPSRLSQFGHHGSADISSVMLCTLPISAISRNVGFESPNDDDVYQFGCGISCPTGKDAMFRFKIIENLEHAVCEYFCLSESPIDFRNPSRSKHAKIYCLWVVISDRMTRRCHKYILWRNVFALCHYETEDSVCDVPVEGAIANEIRTIATMYGIPELAAEVDKYPQNITDVLISEVRTDPVDGIDKFCMLGSNIKAFHDLHDSSNAMYGWNIYDILREVNLPRCWTNFQRIQQCSVLQIVQFGPVTLKDLFFLFSPAYRLHGYQRTFSKKDLSPFTILDLPSDDNKRLFEVIKYVEQLPYNEFELNVTGGLCNIKLYNPVSHSFDRSPESSDQTEEETAVINKIRSVIADGFKDATSVTIKKSWEEEIYITVLNEDKTVDRYYYDLSAASLCSRSLIRDYDYPLFGWGL